MAASDKELAALLGGTPLSGYELGVSPVCNGEEAVLVVGPIPAAKAQESLQAAQSVSDAAERWPVWVCDFATVVGETVFWESEFAPYAPPGAEITPRAITERALGADEAMMLRGRANRHGHDLGEELQYHDEAIGPSRSVVVEAFEQQMISTVGEVGKWVMDWRLRQVPENPSAMAGIRQHTLDYWHEEDRGHLFFLPTGDAWRSTSYLNFFGSGGELSTLLLKKWFDKWEAKVVAHSGTMLNFDVGNPPASLDEAAEVAWEHYLLAPATTVVSGIGLHEYGHALVRHPRWSLHEEP